VGEGAKMETGGGSYAVRRGRCKTQCRGRFNKEKKIGCEREESSPGAPKETKSPGDADPGIEKESKMTTRTSKIKGKRIGCGPWPFKKGFTPNKSQ